jgi:hypothetical protein
MKKDKQKTTDSSRRKFLQGAAGAGAGVAIVAAVPAAVSAADETPKGDKPEGYRLTQHILDYYKSATS